VYSSLPTFVLGFHGCDKVDAERILSGKDRLKPSKNEYDWLGHGSYFWENSPARALDFATALKKNPRPGRPVIKNPFVLGAILDLGHCFNLTDTKCLAILKNAYPLYVMLSESRGVELAKNKAAGDGSDVLLRYLDCAVIESMHEYHESREDKPYDSVRGVFPEGKPVFEDSGIRDKDHIQICIRNPNCIKGYFRVLPPVPGHPIP